MRVEISLVLLTIKTDIFLYRKEGSKNMEFSFWKPQLVNFVNLRRTACVKFVSIKCPEFRK